MNYWELRITFDMNTNKPFHTRDTLVVRDTNLKTVLARFKCFACDPDYNLDWIELNYRNVVDHAIIKGCDCYRGSSTITKTLLHHMGVKNVPDV